MKEPLEKALASVVPNALRKRADIFGVVLFAPVSEHSVWVCVLPCPH